MTNKTNSADWRDLKMTKQVREHCERLDMLGSLRRTDPAPKPDVPRPERFPSNSFIF